MSVLKKVLDFILDLLILGLSAFLASLAFPSKYIEDGIPFLAFFYLIPVFYVIWRSKWSTVWLYGAFYGFLFYFFYNYWLETFHPLAILIAPILESVQYALLFICLRLSKTLLKRHYSLLGSLLYLAYLYLTQQGFLAYPYGNIATALDSYTSLIQIVSVTGIWGLDLVVVLPQVIVSECLYEKEWKENKWDFLISLLILSLTWIGGYFVKRKWEEKTPDRVMRIAAIQHSADTWKGGYSTYNENF